MNKRNAKERSEEAPAQFDDVLKRMLSSPPKQHKDEKHPKPAGKPAQKKPTQ